MTMEKFKKRYERRDRIKHWFLRPLINKLSKKSFYNFRTMEFDKQALLYNYYREELDGTFIAIMTRIFEVFSDSWSDKEFTVLEVEKIMKDFFIDKPKESKKDWIAFVYYMLNEMGDEGWLYSDIKVKALVDIIFEDWVKEEKFRVNKIGVV